LKVAEDIHFYSNHLSVCLTLPALKTLASVINRDLDAPPIQNQSGGLRYGLHTIDHAILENCCVRSQGNVTSATQVKVMSVRIVLGSRCCEVDGGGRGNWGSYEQVTTKWGGGLMLKV